MSAKFKINGNNLISSGKKLATIRGDTVYDASNRKLATFRQNAAYDNAGKKLFSISNQDIKDTSGRRIATSDDVRDEIEGPGEAGTLAICWWFFAR